MELKYRGIFYQPNTDNQFKIAESNIKARFLGRTYFLRRSYQASLSQLGIYKYRGVNY
ncbi:MAG TPA: DUF4278 domain-containing protein [Xenococcaceae cyanobacterium]